MIEFAGSQIRDSEPVEEGSGDQNVSESGDVDLISSENIGKQSVGGERGKPPVIPPKDHIGLGDLADAWDGGENDSARL